MNSSCRLGCPRGRCICEQAWHCCHACWQPGMLGCCRASSYHAFERSKTVLCVALGLLVYLPLVFTVSSYHGVCPVPQAL